MTSSLAAVALFVYNRPAHTRRTLEALAANRGAAAIDLVVFSDAAAFHGERRIITDVRRVVTSQRGFQSVRLVARDRHLGLAASIISGVSDLLRRHASAIVLEDDLVTAPGFLDFMNKALNGYAGHRRVMSVSAYTPVDLSTTGNPRGGVFFHPRPHSWGWGTWSEAWFSIDWQVNGFTSFIADPAAVGDFNRGGEDLSAMLVKQQIGAIDSWAIRWCFAHWASGRVSVYPLTSFIRNIGHDGSGTHGRQRPHPGHDTPLNASDDHFDLPKDVCLDVDAINAFNACYRPGPLQRMMNALLVAAARNPRRLAWWRCVYSLRRNRERRSSQ